MSHIRSLLESTRRLKPRDGSIEIEVKYLIDPRAQHPGFARCNLTEAAGCDYVKRVIASLRKTGSIFSVEETINFIESAKINIIKQLVFHHGAQLKDKKNFYTKTSLAPPVYLVGDPDPPVKLSISSESPIPETEVKYDLVRCKLRLSILPSGKFPGLKDWRIDITLTKKLQKISSVSEIARVRDTLFPSSLTLENFENLAPWKFADSIELEIESLNPDSVSEQTLSAMMKSFSELTGAQTRNPSGDQLQSSFYELANILVPHAAHSFKPPNTRGFKSLTNNVIELTKSTFFANLKPRIEEFYITDKADGLRVILLAKPKAGTIDVITAKGVHSIGIPTTDVSDCVADAEMIDADADKGTPARFLVFDVMMYDGRKLILSDFSERMTYIPDIAKLCDSVFAKTFVESTDEETLFQTVERLKSSPKPFPYTTDGIIFTKKTGEYAKTINYKWKSTEDTTIDFLVKTCPKTLLGIDPYVPVHGKTLYLLFTGIDAEVMRRINLPRITRYSDIFPKDRAGSPGYSPIQFSPSSKPYAYLFYSELDNLNNKICELHYSVADDAWRLHRIRDDKTRDAEHGIAYGNDFRIAELVWQNYFNPITREDFKLTKEEGMRSAYFKEHDVEMYRAMRSYNSFVKESLYKPHKNVSYAIDLGGGKGQDLFRYIRANIKNVLFVDRDIMALNEIITRKYAFATERPKGRFNNAQVGRINIGILEADLNLAHNTITSMIKTKGYSLPRDGVPLIVCNFAIHYFVGTDPMRTNFVNLIKSLIAPGGRFIFTTFDGEKVFDLVKSEGGKWDRTENGKLKYSIHADYPDANFTGNNQQIKVLQPFSDTTYYTEYLVNHGLLQKAFKAVGMVQEIHESFDIYQTTFKDHNKSVNDRLSELDKTYSALYTVNSYYRT